MVHLHTRKSTLAAQDRSSRVNYKRLEDVADQFNYTASFPGRATMRRSEDVDDDVRAFDMEDGVFDEKISRAFTRNGFSVTRNRWPRCCYSFGRLFRWRLRSWFFLFLLGLLGLVFYIANEDVIPVIEDLTGTSHDAPRPPPSSFHVLLPASTRSASLCKTLLSGLALDYPAPILLDWGKQFNNHDRVNDGARVARISSTLDYLQSFKTSEQDEVVVVADSENTWFQLPPDILLARYHLANSKAYHKFRQSLGMKAVKNGQIRQSIIFGASKDCTPNESNEFACSAVPESPLSKNLYGNLTNVKGPLDDYSLALPRFLNSGFIIGPVKDMTRLFQRALVKLQQGESSVGSDQEIFASILGEQEYYREHMRDLHATKLMKLKDYATKWLASHKGDESKIASEERNKTVELFAVESFEYGIGLDYYSDLTVNTAHSQRDNYFITYGTFGKAYQDALQAIVPCDIGLSTLKIPRDLQDSSPPITVVLDSNSQEAPNAWADVPLFTNVCTGKVPATIHQNTWDNQLAKQQWEQLWDHTYLRAVIATHRQTDKMEVREPQKINFSPDGATDDPTLTVNMKSGEPETKIVDASFESLNKLTAAYAVRGSGRLDKLEWWDLCEGQGFEKEIFGQ